MPHQSSRQAGFTLIEVMVSLVIAGTGLLALASMQATALKGGNMASGITTANQMLQNATERILKNAVNVAAYDGMQISTDTTTNTRVNCPTLDPVPACLRDFLDWQNAIAELPKGSMTISSTSSGNFELVTVAVAWEDMMGGHAMSTPFQVAP